MSDKLQLDEFLQDEKSFEVELKGKVYKADVSALTLMSLYSKLADEKVANDIAESTKVLFTAVFGKEDAKELLGSLGVAGIEKISLKIGTYMDDKEGK